jgi:hypothetical protein
MPEQKLTFQAMNGCAACKHAASDDPAGKPAAAYGKSYWCQPLGKAVDAKDGASCPQWEYSG